jgi:hypothetical protein
VRITVELDFGSKELRSTELRENHMTISKLRSFLYATARCLGDLNAVLRGRIVSRFLRRLAGKVSARILGRLFR